MSCFGSTDPTEKGRKKIQKHIEKINKENEKALDQEAKRVLSIKADKIGKVSVNGKRAIYRVKLHADTFNFHHSTSALLQKFTQMQEFYPFLDVHVSKKQNGEAIIAFYWDDYLNYCLSDGGEPAKYLAGGQQAREKMNQVFLHNHQKLQTKLSEILDDPKRDDLVTHQTEAEVILHTTTFKIAKGNDHFMSLVRRFKRENPFCELFWLRGNVICLRVYWQLYSHFLTQSLPPDLAREQAAMIRSVQTSPAPSSAQYIPAEYGDVQMTYTRPEEFSPPPVKASRTQRRNAKELAAQILSRFTPGDFVKDAKERPEKPVNYYPPNGSFV